MFVVSFDKINIHRRWHKQCASGTTGRCVSSESSRVAQAPLPLARAPLATLAPPCLPPAQSPSSPPFAQLSASGTPRTGACRAAAAGQLPSLPAQIDAAPTAACVRARHATASCRQRGAWRAALGTGRARREVLSHPRIWRSNGVYSCVHLTSRHAETVQGWQKHILVEFIPCRLGRGPRRRSSEPGDSAFALSTHKKYSHAPSHTPTWLQMANSTLARKNKLVYARHPQRRLERIVAGVDAAGRVGELDGSIHLRNSEAEGTGRGGRHCTERQPRSGPLRRAPCRAPHQATPQPHCAGACLRAGRRRPIATAPLRTRRLCMAGREHRVRRTWSMPPTLAHLEGQKCLHAPASAAIALRSTPPFLLWG